MAFYSREEFDKLRAQGYSASQIVAMSKGRTPLVPAEKKQGFGKTVSDFVGTTALGKGLAGVGARMFGFDEPIEEALAQSRDIQGDVAAKIREKKLRGEDTSKLEAALAGQQKSDAEALAAQQDIITGGVTGRQVIGGALKTAGTIASFGSFGAAGAAAKGAPSLGAGVGRAMLKGAVTAAPASVAVSAGQALEEGDSNARAAAEALVGGMLGAAVGGVVSGAGQLFSNVVKRGSTAAYNNVLGVTKQMKLAGKSPAEFLKDRKSFGTLGSYYRAAIDGAKQAQTQIDDALAKSSSKINYASVKDAAVSALKKQFGSAYDDATIRALVDEVPAAAFGGADDVPVAAANELRKTLDKILGSNFFVSQSTKPLAKEAMSAVAGALRDSVKKASGTTELFKEYSGWVNVKKLVDGAMANADSFWKPGMFDLIGGGIGASRGDTFWERAKNAAIGAGTVRASRSAIAQTFAAALASKLAQMPTEGITRAMVTQAVAQAMDDLDD